MVKVKACYHAFFSQIAGRDEEVVFLEQPTLGALVESLLESYGAEFAAALLDANTGDLSLGVSLLVNGSRVPFDAELRDGDEVYFLMAMAGG